MAGPMSLLLCALWGLKMVSSDKRILLHFIICCCILASGTVFVLGADWYGTHKLGFPVRFKLAHIVAMVTDRPISWQPVADNVPHISSFEQEKLRTRIARAIEQEKLRLARAARMVALPKRRPSITRSLFVIGDSQARRLHKFAPMSIIESGFFRDGCRVGVALQHVSEASTADVVVIHLGTTDLAAGTPPDQLLKQFGRLLDCLQDKLVIVLLPQPVNDDQIACGLLPGPITNVDLRRLCKQMCVLCSSRRNVLVVDITPRIVDSSGNVPPELLIDAIHFRHPVYGVWRDMVLRAIEQHRGQRKEDGNHMLATVKRGTGRD